jgi:hypothetical protein
MSVEVVWMLIDTTLKVALGGVIAISAAWLFQKNKVGKGAAGSPSGRRLEIFEHISGNVGQVSHNFAKYSALVIESTRFGKTWPAARRMELPTRAEQDCDAAACGGGGVVRVARAAPHLRTVSSAAYSACQGHRLQAPPAVQL